MPKSYRFNDLPFDEDVEKVAREVLNSHPQYYQEVSTGKLMLNALARDLQDHFLDEEEVHEMFYEVGAKVANDLGLWGKK